MESHREPEVAESPKISETIKNLVSGLVSLAGFLLPFSVRGESGSPGQDMQVFPNLSLGTASILNDESLAGDLNTGYLFGFGVGLNMEKSWYSVDALFGWSATGIMVEAGDGHYKGRDEIPTRVTTKFSEAGLSGRLRLSQEWEFGGGFFFPFGTDTSFAPSEDKNSSAHIFWSVEVLRKSPPETSKHPFNRFRYGFQIYKDLNIPDRNVLLIRFQLGYSLSFAAIHRRLYEDEPLSQEGTKTQKRPKASIQAPAPKSQTPQKINRDAPVLKQPGV